MSGIFPEGFPTRFACGNDAKNKHSNNGRPAVSAAGFFTSKAKGAIKDRETTSQTDDLIRVHTDKVETALHREAGPVHVGYQFWGRLGLHEILEKAGLNQRARRLACTMTMNRLIFPLSEHAMPDWIRSTAIEDILGVDFKELAEDAL